MKWDHYEFKVAENPYLYALTYGIDDDEGMSDSEVSQFEAWRITAEKHAESAGWTIGHWTDVADSGEDWGICEVSGLFAMRCSVLLMIYKAESTPC
jgi:glucuronate isomerase